MEMDKLENKIGVMGGTFDPVHNGHLIISEIARVEFGLDKIIFIPSGIPPHKNIFFAPPIERLKMVQLATEDNLFFEVSTIEVDKKEPSYTIDTVLILKQLYKNTKIYLIIGEDSFLDLNMWRNHELLIKEVTFLVARRKLLKKPLEPIKNPFLEYHFIPSPLMEISSSYIRDCISLGKTVKYLIPERVFEYIRRKNLYGFKRD